MKPKNMPERVERRRALAAQRAGVAVLHVYPETDIKFRKGRNMRAKAARKFMGPHRARFRSRSADPVHAGADRRRVRSSRGAFERVAEERGK